MNSHERKSLTSDRSCPFCTDLRENNSDMSKILDLSVSTLYLNKNQTYRGYCILIFNNRHLTGLEKLSSEEYIAFMNDCRKAMLAVEAVVKPQHMNYASLGNIIPHLHFHIIPRYENDNRSGKPIWTSTSEEFKQTSISEDEFQVLKLNIKNKLIQN